MITTLIYIASLAALAHSGVITHDVGGEDDHNKPTSYQTIQMEHFHAVPTYVRKEYKHLLEHPIPAGKSSSKVEIHHGGKHDHGYAITDVLNTARGSGGHDDAGFGGHEGGSLGDHDAANQLAAQAALTHAASGGYQVHDQTQELLQQQLAKGHGAALQLQAAAALSHGGGGLGQFQGGSGYDATAALQAQSALGGHGHS